MDYKEDKDMNKIELLKNAETDDNYSSYPQSNKLWPTQTIKDVINYIKEITWQTWLKIIISLLIIASVITLFIIFRTYISSLLISFFNWVRNIGYWGILAGGAVFTIAATFSIPVGLLTLGMGFAFNFWIALVIVFICANIAANLGFWLGKTFLRKFIEKKIKENPIYDAVDTAIAMNGWKIVILIRLSPIFPFALANYVFGTSSIQWIHFSIASFVGVIPEAFLYVYLGNAIRNISTEFTGDVSGANKTLTEIAFYVGLAITLISVVVITYISKRAISKALIEAEKHKALQLQNNTVDIIEEDQPTSSLTSTTNNITTETSTINTLSIQLNNTDEDKLVTV